MKQQQQQVNLSRPALTSPPRAPARPPRAAVCHETYAFECIDIRFIRWHTICHMPYAICRLTYGVDSPFECLSSTTETLEWTVDANELSRQMSAVQVPTQLVIANVCAGIVPRSRHTHLARAQRYDRRTLQQALKAAAKAEERCAEGILCVCFLCVRGGGGGGSHSHWHTALPACCVCCGSTVWFRSSQTPRLLCCSVVEQLEEAFVDWAPPAGLEPAGQEAARAEALKTFIREYRQHKTTFNRRTKLLEQLPSLMQ